MDYSSYFHQISIIASAGCDIHETMFGGTCMAANLDSFCTNPEILVEKCTKSSRTGGWGVGGQLRLGLSWFVRQKQALNHGLWVLCAEMDVA